MLLSSRVGHHGLGAKFPVQAFPLFRQAGKLRFHIGPIGVKLLQGVNAVAGEKAASSVSSCARIKSSRSV